jgi:hypothetical protein
MNFIVKAWGERVPGEADNAEDICGHVTNDAYFDMKMLFEHVDRHSPQPPKDEMRLEQSSRWDAVKTFLDDCRTAAARLNELLGARQVCYDVGTKRFLPEEALAGARADLPAWPSGRAAVDEIMVRVLEEMANSFYPRKRSETGGDLGDGFYFEVMAIENDEAQLNERGERVASVSLRLPGADSD